MFPRYNPNIPLTHQSYYPAIDRAAILPEELVNRPEYSPSLYSQRGGPSPAVSSNGPKTPHSASNLEDQMVQEPAQDLSTPEELLDMWSIANGQDSQEAADTYVLGLSW